MTETQCFGGEREKIMSIWNALKLTLLFQLAILLVVNRTLAETSTQGFAPWQLRHGVHIGEGCGDGEPVLCKSRVGATDPNSLDFLEQAKVAQINQSPSDSSTRTERQQIDQYSQTLTTPSIQVTSVSQLSDVQPTDWVSLALQSLAKRYGCIAGYSDTYRGNQAITRDQFAARLNACLQQVNKLIAAGTSDLFRKEDLATLQRLQAEFATELTTLRSRVNNLEVPTAQQEADQFSPTTTVSGEALFSVTGVSH